MTDEGRHTESTETRFDLIDRFEQIIGLQATVLGDVGERAGNVTQVVVLVLGVVLSALSIGIRRQGALEVASPTVGTFGLGVVGLFASLVGAIVTYLHIRIELGVHPTSAATVERMQIGKNEYAKLLLSSYADVLEANRRVLTENVRRFRYTLATLMLGIGHLGTATLSYFALDATFAKWVVAGVGSLVTLALCGTILSGRYLVAEVR